MGYSRTVHFEQRLFGAGELARGLATTLRAFGADPEANSFNIAGELPDGTQTERRFLPASSLDEICDLSSSGINGWFDAADGKRFYLALRASSSTTSVYISAEQPSMLAELAEALKRNLALNDAPPQEQIAAAVKTGFEQALHPLEERIKLLEDTIHGPSRRLRCFLSYRFTTETELTALRIQQFLGALDVEVITGAQYEPRRISEKVLSKLRGPLHFLVLLVTTGGESLWTRDEIGAAVHKNLAVVPIVEAGARFEPGLFGDIEYIPFATGHIGDAFLHLLHAVTFIREAKTLERMDIAEPEGVHPAGP